MAESGKYSNQDEIAYLANFPGADVVNDWVVVKVEQGDINITDDEGRKVGVVTVDEGEIDVIDNEERELGVVTLGEEVEVKDFSKLVSALSSEGGDSIITQSREELSKSDHVLSKNLEDGSYEFTFDISENMDTVTVSVDDADGDFIVEIDFMNEDSEVIMSRGPASTDGYQGDEETPVFMETKMVGSKTKVRVSSDTSGENEVNIGVRAN